MASVFDVASYFVHLSYSAGEPEAITTLKLQKLPYYAQALSLTKRGTSLFSDKIKAWSDGPVVPVIWHKYQQKRTVPSNDHKADLAVDDRVFLRQIWKLYGKYSGDELSRMTHEEAPWKNARGKLSPSAQSDAEITLASMREFFAGQRIELPDVPRPIEIRRGREVYRIEDAGEVLPVRI